MSNPKQWWRIGIRMKFFLIFLSSMFLSLICVTVGQSWLRSGIGTSIIGSNAEALEEKYSLAYVVLFFIVTAIIYYFLSYRLMKRIQNIHDRVDEIGAGNWDVTIPARGNDEIGNLGRQIQSMVNNMKQLREKERAQESLKNEMIANISHDLRTPLTSLTGYIELVQSNLQEGKDVQEHHIDVAARKCRELHGQLQDLLDYCTLNYREESSLQKEKINICELLQQVLVDFVPQLEQSNMTFQIHAPGDLIVTEIDLALVVRMLQNIIRNSITYGAAGRRLDFYIAVEDSRVVIRIVNYGEPIPEEDLPYIFDRFYRGEKSRSSDTGGKGLGLAISKSIVEMHRGHLQVESDPMATTFTIRLPL